MKIFTLILTLMLALASVNADAARFGGGRSMGRQSSNVTQRQAAPAQGARPTAPAPAAPAPAPKRPWGAMLGGLAAGLGLAWLANSMGMGGALGQVMTFALLGLGVMLLVGWFLRSRQAAASAATGKPAFAYQGPGNAEVVPMPGSYKPENVGNDASARPWERPGAAFEGNQASGSIIGSGLSGSQSWGIPAGFDSEGFVKSAKANFVLLQSAWDKADMAALRLMTTDAMLKEIQSQLAERPASGTGAVNQTEVLMVEAQLLGIEDGPEDYLASVEFSGMIREEPSAGARPFREVWNMVKPKSGHGGWLVAGVQALE